MSQLRTNSIVPVGGIPAGASGGGIIQIVSTTKTDTFTTTTTGSWIDVTGLSASITPRSTSNKILVIARLVGNGTAGTTRLNMRVARGGTAITQADSYSVGATSLQSAGNEVYNADSSNMTIGMLTHLDSPASISSLSYSIQIYNLNGSSTLYVNRANSEGNPSARGTSTITLMEVSG
jgi:hypothetical protein